MKRYLIDGKRYLIDGERYLIDGLSTGQVPTAHRAPSIRGREGDFPTKSGPVHGVCAMFMDYAPSIRYRNPC